jgi:DNA-binding transcriptional regulator YdaS (Cro superfamily)
MDLSTYIANTEARQRLADDCGTTSAYLWQVATGWRGRKAGIDLVKKIEAATAEAVTRHDLRPDVFGPAPTAPTDDKVA